MLEFGALPDLTDRDGKTSWCNAFETPWSSQFRECDRRTAVVLLEMGAVTSSLDEWRARNVGSFAGTVCHVSVASGYGSPLYRAIRYSKNHEVAKFIVESGGSITDREFLRFHFNGKLKLLCRIADTVMESAQNDIAGTQTTIDEKYINWSYPPTWKKGVEIGIVEWDRSGLPPDMFQSKVVPFLGRDWFFTKEQLTPSNFPPRQSASGEGL
jgi:hypothetical protein